MSQKLSILFFPIDGVGHVNACIGLAQVLQNRGHKIIFVVSKSYDGKLSPYGFSEEFLIQEKVDENVKPGEHGANHLLKNGILSGLSPLEKMKRSSQSDSRRGMMENIKLNESRIKEIVEKHKPDIYIIDHFIGSPALINSDKPWVFLFSGNPLYVISDERTPPGGSGLSSNGYKNSKELKEFIEFIHKRSLKYNQLLKEYGFPQTINNRCIPDSPYLNIYGYPEELDYTDIRPLPEKWFRIDAFMRTEEHKFELPLKLKNKSQGSQKLIYLSLGSMGSIDVELMKRLVTILSKSPHKYIVSKGLFGDKYELPDNMWGENSVPQTKVLPLVDLVITHGGNNTVTETFSFGKPMIVMPLFGDQFDNAQRIQEKGFGVRIEPYSCTEKELLEAIENLLNDNHLKHRLSIASKRMLSSDSIIKASEVIECLVKH